MLRKKHFLITRFNYPVRYKHLKERIRLFNQFTLPSIKAQTSQNFEWLILGNPPIDLPENGRFIKSQNVIEKGITGRGPCPYMAYIKAATKDVDLILMTRLDNDDILMPTYMEDMYALADRAGHVYEFKGYRLDLRNGTFYIDTRHRANVTSPFITVASTPSNLKSVYSHNHGHMWKYFDLIIDPKINWVQVIHNTNWVLNRGGVKDCAKRGILTKNIPDFVRKLMVMEAS